MTPGWRVVEPEPLLWRLVLLAWVPALMGIGAVLGLAELMEGRRG